MGSISSEFDVVIALFGLILIAVVWLTAAFVTADPTVCSNFIFECWLNRYQTLLSGILALVAGFASVHFLKRQIEDTQKLTAADEARLKNASRAMLAISLSDISEYAAECIELSKFYLSRRAEIIARMQVPTYPAPKLPRSAFTNIEQAIKYSNEQVQTGLANLVHLIQIQHARMQDITNRINRHDGESIVTELNLFELVADALEVDGTSSSFFVYARGGDLPENFRKRSSILLHGFHDAEHDDLSAFIEKRSMISAKFGLAAD